MPWTFGRRSVNKLFVVILLLLFRFCTLLLCCLYLRLPQPTAPLVFHIPIRLNERVLLCLPTLTYSDPHALLLRNYTPPSKE